MKKLLVLTGLLAVATLRADDGFLQTLTPAERSAMGLEKLAPRELARIEEAVQRYKSGEIAGVKREAEKKIVAAEAKARGGSDPDRKEEKRKNYWALIFGEVDPKSFAFQSTLPGDYEVFEGKPMFKLANGQQWRATQELHHVCAHPLHEPKVSVQPGAFSAFWLEIEGGPRVKVSPVKRE